MTANSSFQSVKIVCPILKQYSLEDQAKAAEELVEIKKKYPNITQYVADYGDLRRKVRVCEDMR